MLSKFPGDGNSWKEALCQFLTWNNGSVLIVCCIEHLIAQPVFFQTQIYYLPQIPRIYVVEGISSTYFRVFKIIWKQLYVFMWLNHIAYAERVNINTRPALETPGSLLIDDFGHPIDIHGIHIVILLQGQKVRICFPIRTAKAIGSL